MVNNYKKTLLINEKIIFKNCNINKKLVNLKIFPL